MTSLGNLCLLLKSPLIKQLPLNSRWRWSPHSKDKTKISSPIDTAKPLWLTCWVDWRGIRKWSCYCENYNLSMYGASFSIMAGFLVLSRHTPSHLSLMSYRHFFEVNSRKACFHVASQCLIVFILEEWNGCSKNLRALGRLAALWWSTLPEAIQDQKLEAWAFRTGELHTLISEDWRKL